MTATQTIKFFIPGLAAPGGSKRGFIARRKDGSLVCRPNGQPIVNIVDAAGEANKEWRSNVRFFARRAFDGALFTGPLRVEMRFIMPRPKNHFGSGRNVNLLKPDAPKFHCNEPDALKLARSTEDALTGVIWRDDCQTAIASVKLYGEKPGCHVTITPLDDKAIREGLDEEVVPLFAEIL